MSSAPSRRLRTLSALFIVALVMGACWLAFLLYGYMEEGRIIAALEAQGAVVSFIESTSVRERAMVVLRGRREVGVQVFQRPVDLRLAVRLRQLTGLRLWDTVIREEDAEAISEMENLWDIDIRRTRVPRSFWVQLRRAKGLGWVILQDVDVKDEDVAELGKLRSLLGLHLFRCGINDNGLAHLEELDELAYLTVSGSPITGTGVHELRNLPKLRQLTLSKCDLTDDSLKPLALCTSLDSLDLPDNPITDKGLEILCRIERPLSIGLQGTRITDAGLQALERRSACLLLKVDRTAVTEAGIAQLGERTQRVWLSDDGVISLMGDPPAEQTGTE